MNIFLFELRTRRKSAIIWSLALAGILAMYISFFPSFAADATLFQPIIDSFPVEMLKALDMEDAMTFSTIAGYTGFTYTYVLIGLAIQSSIMGFSILSVEESDLTADFLLSKPVSRTKIFSSKIFAASLILIITSIMVVGSCLAISLAFSGGQTVDVSRILLLCVVNAIFQFFFFSMGLFISMMVKKVNNVLSFSVGISLGMFAINAIRGILDSELLGFLTPYNYVKVADVLVDGTFNIPLVVFSISLSIVFVVVSYLRYFKKDIQSV